MKNILAILILFLSLLPLHGQTAADCFRTMPDSLSPLLTAINRADCIDFLESKMKAEVTNTLGGKSEMTHLTTDYLCLQTSAQSTWQMKLLPVNDSVQVICTVLTVCAPLCDSSVRFYSSSWQELPASDYLPSLPASADYILLVQMALSATEPTLTCTFTTPDELKEATKRADKKLFEAARVYRWEGSRFQ